VRTEGERYAQAVGAGLRRIRLQKGMSLHDVQAASGGLWKAAVVGAYERGDRNITIARLHELADFYDVPLAEVLPEDPRVAAPGPPARRRLALNLANLERVPETDRAALERFATAIQIQRGDFNGRVLTIRDDDLLALAILYQTDAADLSRRLEKWGLI
jgi:transcriptional regulator with XRE-family HTH domain